MASKSRVVIMVVKGERVHEIYSVPQATARDFRLAQRDNGYCPITLSKAEAAALKNYITKTVD
jgi:hypothetical protein